MPSLRGLRVPVALLGVPGSQLAMAASGYLVLVLAGREVPASTFTAISAFYLLINTVGRGTFAAAELELTRSVAAARAAGEGGRLACLGLVRPTLGLLLAAATLVLAASPLLLPALGNDPAVLGLLILGAGVMAISYFLRGPLAALGRYRAYAGTFVIEAVLCAGGGVTVGLVKSQDAAVWVLPFILAPLAACAVVGAAAVGGSPLRALVVDAWSRQRRVGRDALPARAAPALIWSSVLFLASQGVWNLGAVIVSARAVATPEVAAGFVAVSVVLRAPVLLFPAVQALLLPSVTAEAHRGDRGLLRSLLWRWAPILAATGFVWMLAAHYLLPPATRRLFDLATLPGSLVVDTLAGAAVLGAAAQLFQTQLIARREQRGVALVWVGGLAVLLVLAMVLTEPARAGGFAQLAAVAVVVIGMVALTRRSASVGPSSTEADNPRRP